MSFPDTTPPWAATDEALLGYLGWTVGLGMLLIVGLYLGLAAWVTQHVPRPKEEPIDYHERDDAGG